MIYIPMLKTRKEEYSILKKMSYCFSEKIIPMVEIISEKYRDRYAKDLITGEFLYEQRGKRKLRVKAKHTIEDVITLENIADTMNGNRIFIDYFRFSNKVYGNNVDITRAALSWKLSNDVEEYKVKLLDVAKYPNMIPVISIKEDFGMGKNELQELIEKLQGECQSIALRITEQWIEEYTMIIEKKLRKEDFLLLDIGEQNPEHKFMEIEQVKDTGTEGTIILLNSPRKRDVKNAEFPERGKANLIINNAIKVVSEYGLGGYGDYCGLKDSMPLNDGSNGTGAALALFYSFSENVFYSYSNHDTSQGVMGYRVLVPRILEDRVILDPENDCPGYKKIEEMNGFGNWSTWHNINATRYIYQIYKYL